MLKSSCILQETYTNAAWSCDEPHKCRAVLAVLLPFIFQLLGAFQGRVLIQKTYRLKKKKQQHRGYSFKRCIRSFGFPGLYKGGCESLSCMFVHLYTNTPVQAQIRQIQRAGNKQSQHICIHPPARDSAVSVHTTHTTTPLPQSPYSASQPCMRVDRRWVFCTLQHSERADSAVGKILSSEHITNL